MATSGKPLDPQTRKQIVRLRQNGISIRQIATTTRATPKTVQSVLRRDRLLQESLVA
ncbi:MAG: helix-turn-helix domain-containing protein [Deltaproteobacteria bacterium]